MRYQGKVKNLVQEIEAMNVTVYANNSGEPGHILWECVTMTSPRKATPPPVDRVILRRWKDTSALIALFPDIDAGGGYVSSYEHIGQHGQADYLFVLKQTEPVTDYTGDAKDLLNELTNIGYNWRVCQRR